MKYFVDLFFHVFDGLVWFAMFGVEIAIWIMVGTMISYPTAMLYCHFILKII
jgi:hypothetical protein